MIDKVTFYSLKRSHRVLTKQILVQARYVA